VREAEYAKSSFNFKRSMQYLNLFVKGFDPMTTKEELEAFFGEFGTVKSLKIIPDSGRALVCYEERDGARFAKE
jgi:RNA recognition motif-containing protein